MSVGTTIAGRHADYSPSRKPIVPSLEGGGGEPVRLDEIVERSGEPRDDRHDRHVFAKSVPSSTNTCASETDEADYETSSEGPSRLVEGKSSHTRVLSKSHSVNLRKEEATENSKKLPEMEELADSRPYTYVREGVEEDTAIGSVSLPILRSMESIGTTQVENRMSSDSSFARQQKLQMIIEQTEFLLSTESRIGPTTGTPDIDCCLAKEYEVRRRESLMLLPVIQDIKRTNPATGTISKEMEDTLKPFDQGPNFGRQRHRYHTSRDLIDIAENPESSSTSFYLPPYPVNYARSYRMDDSISATSTTIKARGEDVGAGGTGGGGRRRVSNDTDVLLKIHGELSPLRCELGEIAAKFRALKFQRMAYPFEDNTQNCPMLLGKNIDPSNYALLRRTDIDRVDGGGGLHARCCLVGNPRTQFSPITMVGKSNSRESCSRHPSSIGTTRLFAAPTGFHRDHHRSYLEQNDPAYFQIASGHDSSVATEYLGERTANSRPVSSLYERYRPRSSCVHDRYHRSQQQRGLVRSSDGPSYEMSYNSRNSYDTDGTRYISRPNTGEPPDLLILASSKEVVREEDHRAAPARREDRYRSKEDLRGSSMANVFEENSLSGDRGRSSVVSLCKERRVSHSNARIRCTDEKRSICRMESVEMVDGKTSTDSPIAVQESRLVPKHQRHRHHHHRHRHQHQQTTIVDRSSQTSAENIELKERANVSSITEKRIRVISVPKTLEKVKIVPVLFTAGIPEPLLPFFYMDDPTCPGNPRERTGQRMVALKRRNSRRISSPSSGKRGPSESEASSSYVTGPLALPRDYFSENERWRSNTNSASKLSVSCVSRSDSSKKTSSSNALKYTSAVGSVGSGGARATTSGSILADEKRRKQIRETSVKRGIRGMRSSPEDFLCDT